MIFRFSFHLSSATDKHLNYVKKVTDHLKKCKTKNAIGKETYSKPRLVVSITGIFYGSAKVHKPRKNQLPSFKPLFSAIGTPTYKQEEYLVPIQSNAK